MASQITYVQTVQDRFDTRPIANGYRYRRESRMERQQLEYFVAIVEHASFTRAAASLNVAQPSLSRAMKSLERELGVQLFRRTGREIVVTEVASDLARRARMIVQDFDALAAAAHASSGAVGRVEIATTPSTAIEPMTAIVDALRHEHPGLTVSAIPTPNAAEVVAAVDKGRCELGLCGQLGRPIGRNIVTSTIGHDEVVLITPPGSALANLRSVPPNALHSQRFVVAPARTTLRTLFDQLAEQVREYTVAVEVGHREAIVPMVLRGIGVALHVREWTTLAKQAGAGVVSLEPAVFIPKWFVRRKSLNEQSQAFIDVLARTTQATHD